MWRNLSRNILATLKKRILNVIKLRTKQMPGMAIGATKSMSCPDFQRAFKSNFPLRYATPKARSQTSISQPCRVQRDPYTRLQYNNLRSSLPCAARSAIDFVTAGSGLDYSTKRFAKSHSTCDCSIARPTWEYYKARPVRDYINARPVRDYSKARPVRDYTSTRSTTDFSTRRNYASFWNCITHTVEPRRSKCDPAKQSPELSNNNALRLTAHCNLLPNFCYPDYVPPTNPTFTPPPNKTKAKGKSNSVEDMVNTFACAGSCEKPTDKGPSGGPCPGGGSCLPPPGNPPQCLQFISGYYYYPYGTWFCGPYHVATAPVPVKFCGGCPS